MYSCSVRISHWYAILQTPYTVEGSGVLHVCIDCVISEALERTHEAQLYPLMNHRLP
jgi:hypothetical protein